MTTNNKNILFCELLKRCNLTEKEASNRFCLSEKSLRRYRLNQSKPPQILILLLTYLSGDLSVINSQFAGFRLIRDEIVTPNNVCFGIDHLNYIEATFGELRELRFKKQEMAAEIECLKQELNNKQRYTNQPLPKAEIIDLKYYFADSLAANDLLSA